MKRKKKSWLTLRIFASLSVFCSSFVRKMENKSLGLLCAWKTLANIYSWIFCTQDKNLAHSMQGKEGKKTTTKNKEWLLFCTTRINKIHAIHLHTLCDCELFQWERIVHTSFLSSYFSFLKIEQDPWDHFSSCIALQLFITNLKHFTEAFFSYYGFQGFFLKMHFDTWRL